MAGPTLSDRPGQPFDDLPERRNGEARCSFARSLPAPSSSEVDIADFNSDSKLDLVAADKGNTAPRPGNRSGPVLGRRQRRVFLGDRAASAWTTVTGPNTTGLPPVDLNGDGHADLLTVTWWAYSGAERPDVVGGRRGHFMSPTVVVWSPYPFVLKAADFNGDGKADVAMPDEAGVWIRLGDGAGGFGPASAAPDGRSEGDGRRSRGLQRRRQGGRRASTADFSGLPSSTYFLPGTAGGASASRLQSAVLL